MPGPGKKGLKFCYDGDERVADFANSTRAKNYVNVRKPSSNVFRKDGARAIAANPSVVKKGQIKSSINQVQKDRAIAIAANVVKKEKVTSTINQTQEAKKVNTEDLAWDEQPIDEEGDDELDWYGHLSGDLESIYLAKDDSKKRAKKVNTEDLAWYEQPTDEDSEEELPSHGLPGNENLKHFCNAKDDNKKRVKKVKNEDLPWDEQPTDEDSEEELAAYRPPDDEDLENLYNGKDSGTKRAGSPSPSSDALCLLGKEVQNEVAVKKEAMEQYKLRNNLLVLGLKEKLGEVTKVRVVDLFQKHLKLCIALEDITLARRIGKQRPPGKHRAILVTFKTYSDRRKVFNFKRRLKSSGIMIIEDLTLQRFELFKIMVEKFGEKETWTQDGTVFWINREGIKCSATRKADLEFSNLGSSIPSLDQVNQSSKKKKMQEQNKMAVNEEEIKQNKMVVNEEEIKQYNLRNNLRIHGLKEEFDEDTKARVVELCQKVQKLNIRLDDITQAQRLGKPRPSGQCRTILVTFKSHSDWKNVFLNKTQLKSSGVKIYQDLTAQRSELLKIVQEHNIGRKVWIEEGTVCWYNHNGIKCSAKRKDDLKFQI